MLLQVCAGRPAPLVGKKKKNIKILYFIFDHPYLLSIRMGFFGDPNNYVLIPSGVRIQILESWYVGLVKLRRSFWILPI